MGVVTVVCRLSPGCICRSVTFWRRSAPFCRRTSYSSSRESRSPTDPTVGFPGIAVGKHTHTHVNFGCNLCCHRCRLHPGNYPTDDTVEKSVLVAGNLDVHLSDVPSPVAKQLHQACLNRGKGKCVIRKNWRCSDVSPVVGGAKPRFLGMN